MKGHNINGWEKLKGVHQLFSSNFSTVQIDITRAEKSDTYVVCPKTFNPIDVYNMQFKIYHPSRGTSNQIYLQLNIYTGNGNCEIKVNEDGILQYHNWFPLSKYIDKFKSPTSFIGWIINVINKQHRYYEYR